MLSTINFIIANKGIKCCIRDGYNVNMNMLWIFVGQPSTGKVSFK